MKKARRLKSETRRDLEKRRLQAEAGEKEERRRRRRNMGF